MEEENNSDDNSDDETVCLKKRNSKHDKKRQENRQGRNREHERVEFSHTETTFDESNYSYQYNQA